MENQGEEINVDSDTYLKRMLWLEIFLERGVSGLRALFVRLRLSPFLSPKRDSDAKRLSHIYHQPHHFSPSTHTRLHYPNRSRFAVLLNPTEPNHHKSSSRSLNQVVYSLLVNSDPVFRVFEPGLFLTSVHINFLGLLEAYLFFFFLFSVENKFL